MSIAVFSVGEGVGRERTCRLHIARLLLGRRIWLCCVGRIGRDCRVFCEAIRALCGRQFGNLFWVGHISLERKDTHPRGRCEGGLCVPLQNGHLFGTCAGACRALRQEARPSMSFLFSFQILFYFIIFYFLSMFIQLFSFFFLSFIFLASLSNYVSLY